MTDPTPLDAATAAARTLEAIDRHERLVVVLRPAPADEPGRARRRIVFDRATAEVPLGSLGDPPLDDQADRWARRILAGEVRPGLHDDLYFELHAPRPDLVIVGAGHLAQPLCTLGALLGCRVVVADDRSAFATAERFPEAERVVVVDFTNPFADIELRSSSRVVLVTRGHRYDYECLRRILSGDIMPAYLGMIGSRRRVRATFEALQREAIPRDRMARVRAPVGLDIGAQTPAEIAVSVAAELVLVERGGSGQPLSAMERVLERLVTAASGASTERVP